MDLSVRYPGDTVYVCIIWFALRDAADPDIGGILARLRTSKDVLGTIVDHCKNIEYAPIIRIMANMIHSTFITIVLLCAVRF